MGSARRGLALTLVALTLCWSPVDLTGQGLSGSVLFVKPANPKPFGRIDATIRGARGGGIELMSMTPKSEGPLTTTAQPTLYWFLSGKTDSAATFLLRRHGSRSPTAMFECEIRGPIPAGVHEIKLSSYKVSLESNTDYSWSIKLQNAAETQKIDTIMSYIVVPDLRAIADFREKVTATSPENRYKLYNANSYWYDALATIVALLDSRPLSSDYRSRYVELLRAEGLDDVAADAATPVSVASTCSASSSR